MSQSKSDELTLTPPASVTDQQLRDSGFAGMDSQRDQVALRLLCAFNGVDPAKAPPGWWAHPNSSTKKAWLRVADEARRMFGPQGNEVW